MTETTDAAKLKTLHALVIRNIEINRAVQEYPGLEVGAAYKKWKEDRGETAALLLSTDTKILKGDLADLTHRLHERHCTREGCAGVQFLESICLGCVEGQAGYRTKWTCHTCLHRDLSKKEYLEWLKELSSSEKA